MSSQNRAQALQNYRDLNNRFQLLSDRLTKFVREGILDTALFDFQKLITGYIDLKSDFVSSSKTYGRIIISERYVPLDKKTIKPVSSIGGVAGGEKYIVNNILFKFAVDNGLYGSEYAAMKVAGHELKGLNAYLDCHHPDLCVPLMALIDYMGFRLIAMTLLPLERGSLIYGTDDAGKTIQVDSRISQPMKECAALLNIKSHLCGPDNGVLMHSAADIEGHAGTDHRLYLLDFSRTFPPTMPDPQIRQGHLFQLFRQEALLSYSAPLCPDAYSGFIRPDPERGNYNLQVREATDWLLQTHIPKIAIKIASAVQLAVEHSRLHELNISTEFHRYGINIRYLGHVISALVERDPNTSRYLLLEAIARVIKNGLRRRLRRKLASLQMPLQAPYHQVIINYLNNIFGDSVASAERTASEKSEWNNSTQSAWTGIIHWINTSFYLPCSLVIKCLTHDSITPSSSNGPSDLYSLAKLLRGLLDQNFSKQNSPNTGARYILFLRIQELTCVHFRPSVLTRLRNSRDIFNNLNPFSEMDLISQGLRIKHTTPMAFCDALYCLNQSRSGRTDEITSIELLEHARTQLSRALSASPRNPIFLHFSAQVSYFILEYTKGFSVMDHDSIAVDTLFCQAIDAWKKAPGAVEREHPALAETCMLYARFLDKCSRTQLAEKNYLHALEINPNHIRALSDYISFLTFHNSAGYYIHDPAIESDIARLSARASAIRASGIVTYKSPDSDISCFSLTSS